MESTGDVALVKVVLKRKERGEEGDDEEHEGKRLKIEAASINDVLPPESALPCTSSSRSAFAKGNVGCGNVRLQVVERPAFIYRQANASRTVCIFRDCEGRMDFRSSVGC